MKAGLRSTEREQAEVVLREPGKNMEAQGEYRRA
jgi:hypothetical protein